MPIPFIEDQAWRRHQIQHRGDDIAVEPRRRLLAEFGESALVLRPQAVHHERIGPRPALLLRWCAAFAGGFAERRGPRKREHVEVELTGVVLAPILRRRDTDIHCEPHRDRGEPHATDIANHGGHSHKAGTMRKSTTAA